MRAGNAVVQMIVAAALVFAGGAVAFAKDGPLGQPAPALTLASGDGKTYSLEEARGQRVVLVFYRGVW